MLVRNADECLAKQADPPSGGEGRWGQFLAAAAWAAGKLPPEKRAK